MAPILIGYRWAGGGYNSPLSEKARLTDRLSSAGLSKRTNTQALLAFGRTVIKQTAFWGVDEAR
jgi:hypothetical protein